MSQSLLEEDNPDKTPSGASATPSFRIGGYRWVICGLLFFATTFNYLDRQVISYLKGFFCTPLDKGGFGWSNTDYANLTSFFTAFYAGMTIIAGWAIDKIGTKIGLALSLIIWSICGVANAFVGGLVQMHILIRSAFAIGEGGNFPASIKTVAEWFPKRERALATGIFNSGSNFGAMVAALTVPRIADRFGWKMAFIVTGATGFLWLIFWFWLYEIPARQKRLSKAEFDYIHSDRDDAKVEEKPAGGSTFGKLFTFQGRIPRAAFWGTVILMVILTLFIFLMSTLVVFPNSDVYILSFRIVWLACMAWVFIAALVKRWHDLGKGASVLALGFSEGDPGSNEYGEKPTPGVLGHRQTWSFFWGKFLTDGIWWFYLFWLPDYLRKQFHMTDHQIMWPTFIVYAVAIVGSVYGGSIPLTLIKRGMPVYNARMLSMLLIAISPLAVLTTQFFGDVGRFGATMAPVLAIAMICIGASAHQAWSANLFTTVSDMFPKKSVGSVTGIGAMAGGLGGVLVQKLAGGLTDAYKANPQTAYLIMFIVCAVSYLVAWAVMKALVPRHQLITDL